MPFNLFFERCGEFFFAKMRPLFFFVLLPLPVLGALILIFLSYTELKELKERFSQAVQKEKIAFERKAKKEQFLKRYSQAHPYFLDQQIESLPLLQEEKKRLEALLHHPAFPESAHLQERLKFIETNRLSFLEENIRSSGSVKEIDEKQQYPVQMDEKDLQKLLSLIEDTPIDTYQPATHSPQLIVKDIRIKKRQTPLQTEVFEVNMELLTREFKK